MLLQPHAIMANTQVKQYNNAHQAQSSFGLTIEPLAQHTSLFIL